MVPKGLSGQRQMKAQPNKTEPFTAAVCTGCLVQRRQRGHAASVGRLRGIPKRNGSVDPNM